MTRLPFIDCHTHSDCSPDGNDSVPSLCERAVDLGLLAYAVTDHCEANAYREEYEERSRRSASAILDAKDRFKGKLNLLLGIELGQPMQALADAEAVLAAHPYDVVIGSLHNLTAMEDFYFLDYTETDPYALLERYFDELLRMVRWGKFDVLGHLTYPLRYMEGRAKLSIDMSRFDEVIRAVLRSVAEQGLAIEINTSGLRQEIGRTLPDLSYVKLFHELGGEFLTLGSDAHRREDIGKGIPEALEIARAAGFTRICYFKERKPVTLTL